MELIYFISGILSVGVVYGVVLLRKVKSSHTDLLARYQSHSNISSIRYADIGKEVDEVIALIRDVQSNMEKDQYESLSEINKKVSKMDKLVSTIDKRVSTEGKLVDKNFRDIFNEIQQVKNTLKAMGQDPNFLSRY